MHTKKKLLNTALGGLASAALILGAANVSFAQSHSGGQGGGGNGASHDNGGSQGQKGRGGSTAGQRGGSSQGDLRDVFEQMEEQGQSQGINEHGSSGKGTPRGQVNSGRTSTDKGAGRSSTESGSRRPTDRGGGFWQGQPRDRRNRRVGRDSDRPDYAGPGGRDNKPGRGNAESGTQQGDIYGDMYVILRDANGVPILDANGYVQVKYVDANGDLQCCILRSAEGDLLPTLSDGTAVAPVEVEFGRLSVGRSPEDVLAAQYKRPSLPSTPRHPSRWTRPDAS